MKLYDESFEVDEPVGYEPEAEDQDAPRVWVLDDGTDSCYKIVTRPSHIRQALCAATHNNGWTSFIDPDGYELFVNVNKLIAIGSPAED